MWILPATSLEQWIRTFNKIHGLPCPQHIGRPSRLLKVSLHRSMEVERGAVVVYDVGMKRRKEVNDMADVIEEVKKAVPPAKAKPKAKPKAEKPKAVEPPK